MADRVQLARRDPRGSDDRTERGLLGLVALFLLVAVALLARPWWMPLPLAGVIVEVRGDVAAPGVYRVDPPTARAAVEVAGGPSEGIPEQPVSDGDAVIVGPGGIRVAPMGDPLLVLLPVDLNTADAAALAAVPGIGPETAARILADREARGPFMGLDGVKRVEGVGDRTVLALAPFATARWSGPPPVVDVNRAGVDELVRLPGIGPALAERIVEDRAQHGPFPTVDALTRVAGIGPSTVEGLSDRASVGAP